MLLQQSSRTFHGLIGSRDGQNAILIDYNKSINFIYEFYFLYVLKLCDYAAFVIERNLQERPVVVVTFLSVGLYKLDAQFSFI